LFTFENAYSAKFYFDRMRIKHKILFDSHYNILESVLKNAYICQQVILRNPSPGSLLLDMGCGNGHLSRAIAEVTQIKCIGFDPKINIKTRYINFKFNLKNLILGKSARVRVYKKNHVQFMRKFDMGSFKFIIDNCSVTHFDSRANKQTNSGWNFVVESLSKSMSENSFFICATDVVVGNLINSEFCYESDLLSLLLENNLEVLDTNSIIKESDFKDLETHYSEFLKSEFKRVPPPNTVEGQALGIFGFVAKAKK